MKICPKCGKEYNEPSALSREDNKTSICSICGIKEALEDAVNAGMVDEKDVDEIIKLVKK